MLAGIDRYDALRHAGWASTHVLGADSRATRLADEASATVAGTLIPVFGTSPQVGSPFQIVGRLRSKM